MEIRRCRIFVARDWRKISALLAIKVLHTNVLNEKEVKKVASDPSFITGGSKEATSLWMITLSNEGRA
jgi:hypothetical protein